MTGPPGVRKSRNSMAEASARLITPVREWKALVEDVSLSGLRTRRPPGFALTASQLLEVELSIRDIPALRLRARVVRLGEEDIAFRFDRPSPPVESDLRSLIKRFGELRDSFH